MANKKTINKVGTDEIEFIKKTYEIELNTLKNAYKSEKKLMNENYKKETSLEAVVLLLITALCVTCTALTLFVFKTNVISADRSGETIYSFVNNTTVVNILRLVGGLGALASATCLFPLTAYIIKLCRKEQ